MKKSFKKVALILMSVLVTLIIITITLAYVINPNDYKNTIAEKFYKATGRNLVLTGPISVSFFPNIHVLAKQVAITNPSQLKSGDFIEIALVDFSMELLPLLKGTFHFTHITLDGLNLNLIENKNFNNWSFAGANSKPEKTITNTVINKLSLKNTKVSYKDLENSKSIATKKFNLFINQENGEIKASNNQLELTNTSVDLNKSLQGILNFKIIFESDLSYKGNFLIKNILLSNLASMLNIKLPDSLKPLGLNMKTSAKLTGTENKFKFNNLQLTIGNTYINGNMDIGVKPYSINNNLKINHVNLQDFVDLQGFGLEVESIALVGNFSAESKREDISGLETIKANEIILYGLDIKKFNARITKVINDISVFKRLITYTHTLETIRLLKQELQKIQEERKKNYQDKSQLGQFNGAVMAQNGHIVIKVCKLTGLSLDGQCSGGLNLPNKTINFLIQGRMLSEGKQAFINYIYFPYFIKGNLDYPSNGLDWAYIVKQTTNYYNNL